MSVLIDSNVIVWGIKKKPTEGQENMIELAERWFDYWTVQKIDVLIPTPVLTEILSDEPPEKVAEYLRIINKSYIVCDYDVRVAKKAAELIQARYPELKQYRSENNIRRDKMKFDHIIVACGIVYNVDCIFSNDPHLGSFAGDLIPVKDIADSPPHKIRPIKTMDIFGNETEIKGKIRRGK
jgi:hypothetical protein